MKQQSPLRVSYCTTCKGRLHHLKETLPRNLAAEAGNPDVEFVVLDYDSRDGLGDWIRTNFADEIATGRLKYVRYDDAPHFNMAHAKNMAHRMAGGDILCNLDADNILAPDYSRFLQRTFAREPHTIVTPDRMNVQRKKLGDGKSLRGIFGRIAIAREDFMALRGYNERYEGWGGDDGDFVVRASAAGLRKTCLPVQYMGDVILHSDAERVAHYRDGVREESFELATRSRVRKTIGSLYQKLKPPEHAANADGMFGCGTVQVNFGTQPAEIPPFAKTADAAAGQAGDEKVGEPSSWRERMLDNGGLEYLGERVGYRR